jgi:hypothetical protein
MSPSAVSAAWNAPYAFAGDPQSRVVGVALHAGHDVRSEVAGLLALDEATRLREEDAFTDRLTACAGFRVVVNRSRFEVDLNRPRDEAVYLTAEESWGLDLWREPPPPEVVERSLAIHDSFYADLAGYLDPLAATGQFVVFDLHSYNHRRGGPDGELAPAEENPDVNVGTGSMGEQWRFLVDEFADALSRTEVCGEFLDVRENIKFVGRGFPRWVHARYPETGCAIAVEFKKTFMDEWTGEADFDHLDALAGALRGAVPRVLAALTRAA